MSLARYAAPSGGISGGPFFPGPFFCAASALAECSRNISKVTMRRMQTCTIFSVRRTFVRRCATTIESTLSRSSSNGTIVLQSCSTVVLPTMSSVARYSLKASFTSEAWYFFWSFQPAMNLRLASHWSKKGGGGCSCSGDASVLGASASGSGGRVSGVASGAFFFLPDKGGGAPQAFSFGLAFARVAMPGGLASESCSVRAEAGLRRRDSRGGGSASGAGSSCRCAAKAAFITSSLKSSS
mmetsp:Transcript_23162/g.53594  ORF Transcript_23162/g.53594 Transcript_23162/m.53594 type:complete len:240 (-) Transcript_23162:925-1644(-)